ncbi:MAG: HlyD family type I secretion periplasmic adaptor subunit [Gammaproteobacteria bacterium]|jgi:membrane fusion protein, adhesin transport system
MNTNKNPDIVAISGGDERPPHSLKTLLDEEGHATGKLRAVLLLIALLVIAFLAWSFIAKVEELAKARGEIKPVARVQQLQTQEGGILAELMVERDDFVEEGQVIARFISTNLDKDKAQAEIRRAALQISLERWGAVAEFTEPDFSAWRESYPVLVAEANALYQNQLMLNQARVDVRKEKLDQLKAQLEGLERELPSAEQEVASLREILERDSQAAETGLVSAIQVAEAKSRVASAEKELKAIESRIAETNNGIDGALSEIEQVTDEIIQEARTERSKLIEQVDELTAELDALNTRQGRREIVATVDGYIQNVPETKAGAVLQPGGIVAEIVPSEGGVIMEAMVTPRDIGFLRQGQKAIVKIDAFDFSRFGSVSGKVLRISPTAFKNERDGSSFYKVDIELEKQHMGSDEGRRLMPGMTAEADIVTGEKTVFQYIAKPVFIGLDTAFSER